MLIPLAYKYNILENIIDEVRYGFLLIYASITYSAVFLLHTPAPAPIKISFGAMRCGSCGCVGEAYTLFRRCDQNWGSPYNESKVIVYMIEKLSHPAKLIDFFKGGRGG